MEKLLCHLTPPRLLLFIAALLGSNITASADSHCDFTVNNIHYNFISGSEDEIEVTYWDYESGRYGGYTNDYTGSVTVPATVSYNSKTYKVTAVGRSAFVECSGLTSVSLPSTITSIGSYAFGDCSKLTTVNVPQSVTTIGNSAFSGCVSLYSVNIPKVVTAIAASTFENCRALLSIVIPENVKTIGVNAFKGCSNLYSITIPDGVESVGSDAFYGTSWLTNQPAGVVYVGKVAYKYAGTMPSSTDITLKEGTTEIAGAAFSDCSGLETISIPEGVTAIGVSAFTNCTSLKAITLPKSIISMGGNLSSSAFYGCTALKDVTILCPNVGDWWFREVDAIKSVTFGEEVKTIGNSAFYFCKGLTSITIPENITSIGNEAFCICTNLASVTIANSQASIAYNAFSGTPWMDNQPDGLIYIGQVAYRYKGEMPEGTNVVIKDGTIEIADHAFSGCSGLESIVIPEGIDSIGNYAFQYCRGLQSAAIPGSATSIGSSVFADCENLASVTLHEGIADINTSMFSNCKKLASFDIPASVKSIGYNAFYGCTSLSSIIIPQTVTIIGRSSFYGCTALTHVLISNGVKAIDSDAFHGCSRLASVTIPSSVEAIGGAAFADCPINEVTVKAKEPIAITSNVFSYYSNYNYYSYANMATLYVPDGCKAAYETADVWKDFKEILEFGDAYSLCGTNVETLVGTKDILSIDLENLDEVKLCQFDLRLPSGVAVITMNNGRYDVSLTERAENHRVSSTRLSNGDYRFVLSSLDNDSFTGNSGILINIGLDVSETMEAGEYAIKVLNTELSVPDGNDLMVVRPKDTESKLTVKSYTPGDVNSDGSVSVTDVGCAINYILEQVPSTFVFEAADMNGDKTVSVTDVGMIINLILSEGSASRKEGNGLATNKDEFIGFQFDVKLAEGAAIGDMKLSGGSDHLLTYRQLAGGTWRVVCYSPTNSTFATSIAGQLAFNSDDVVAVSNIRLTTADFEELRPSDLSFSPTGIASVKEGMRINVQDGILSITSDRKATLPVYSLDGRVCRNLYVKKGQNRFDGLRPGIYMINNQKMIIR